MSRLLMDLPSYQGHSVSVPFFDKTPPPKGRQLPNKGLLVVDEDQPSQIFKFSHWEKSVLAWHEIDIYARWLSAGNYPGVVSMLGISATQDYLVRVMERSHTGTLEQFLFDRYRGQVLDAASSEAAIPFLLQIAETMACLHAAGLVHRDLKSENILVFPVEGKDDSDPSRWRVKVSDFDRAVHLPEGDSIQEPVGSLFHMAPELLRAAPYDHRVDIYAFGILMFEVLHGGARPYRNVATGMPGALSRTEFSYRVIHEGYRPHWEYRNPQLEELARRCCLDDPSQRPTFMEIRDSLCLGGVGEQACSFHPAREQDTGIVGVGLASTVGKVRKRMEDAISIVETEDSVICCVCDGMRGERSSEYVVRRLPLVLANALAEQADAATLITQVFEDVQTALRRLDPLVTCGTTASVLVLKKEELIAAWVGDSPIWRLQSGGLEGDGTLSCLPLMQAHHPDCEQEAKRIVQQGGEIRREQKELDSGEVVAWGPLRVFAPELGQKHGIALSRALGLPGFSPIISHQPEIRQVQIHPDDRFLILASDGVFEVLSPEMAAAIVVKCDSVQKAADEIIAQVLVLGAPDNASVVVLDKRPESV
ncbi:MAG: bifunctional serine/threonine-protein kinase/phosphatase [Alcaligenes sp.]